MVIGDENGNRLHDLHFFFPPCFCQLNVKVRPSFSVIVVELEKRKAEKMHKGEPVVKGEMRNGRRSQTRHEVLTLITELKGAEADKDGFVFLPFPKPLLIPTEDVPSRRSRVSRKTDPTCSGPRTCPLASWLLRRG